MTQATLSDAQQQLIDKAEATRVATGGAAYKWGGNTIAGFDCSGFVIHVFNEAYGTHTLADVTADDLRTGGRFPAVTTPRPADLVFFSPQPGGGSASHVAIVVDAERWIGSQNSTGVAYVKFVNTYWKPRILSYGRYTGLQRADAIIPMTAGAYASPICPVPICPLPR